MSDTITFEEFGVLGETGVSKETEKYQLDRDVSPESLSDTEKELLERDELIIYGLGSVEQFDREGQKIELDALEESLDGFFQRGAPITVKHSPLFVGEALREYEVEDPATIEVNGETKSFEAGDTVSTGVDGDEFWVVASIYGGDDERATTFSKRARLACYHGQFDGFSVGVENNTLAVDTESGKETLTDSNLMEVTLTTREDMANQSAEFDVLAIKEIRQNPNLVRETVKTIDMNVPIPALSNLFGEAKQNLAEATIEKALTESTDFETSAKELADEDSELIAEQAEEMYRETKQDADSAEELAEALAGTDTDTDTLTTSIKERESFEAESDEMDDEEEMDEDEDEDEEMKEAPEQEEKEDIDEAVEMIADEMDVPVSAVMEMLSTLDEDESADEQAGDDSEEMEALKEVTESIEELSEEINSVKEKQMTEEDVESVAESIVETKTISGTTPEQENEPASKERSLPQELLE
jgi:hypothetical protein